MKVVPVVAVFLLLGGANSARAQTPRAETEEFSFYGLRFGMSAEQVQAQFPTANPGATEIATPGHGMVSLALAYDYRGRLSEIRAAWERPIDRLQDTALRQALREKFTQPIPARWRTVTVDIDEAWNRAALTLVIVSGDLRQEAIEHYKAQYLKRME
jgi:hypothetical protein